MRYRNVGRSGLEVSEVGLGTNAFGIRFDAGESGEIVRAAIEEGVTFIDTSRVYANGTAEEYVGRALDGGLRREMAICTKFGSMRDYGPNKFGSGRKHVMDAIEGSLRRLRTDYVDLYMMHRPDPRVGADEALRTMEDLVRQGKTLYTGTCNTPAWWLTEMVWTARANGLEPMAATSFEYSLVSRSAEAEMIPSCRKNGVGVIPYWPLAQGLLTGKYRAGERFPVGSRFDVESGTAERRMTGENLALVDALTTFAEGQGRTVHELAFAWLLAKDEVASVIAGASAPGQVRQNCAAAEWRLSGDEIEEVERILAKRPPARGERYYSVADYFDRPVELPARGPAGSPQHP